MREQGPKREGVTLVARDGRREVKFIRVDICSSAFDMMKAPSTTLLKAFSPVWRAEGLPWTARGCQWQQKASFSSTEQKTARKNRGGEKRDMRISADDVVASYMGMHLLTTLQL